jgi:hypothetical protein
MRGPYRATSWEHANVCRAVVAALLGILAFVWQSPAMAQANVQGTWTTLPYQMPINPVHVALLRSGKILIVSGSGNYPPDTDYEAAVLDLQAGTIATQPLAWDMFCNGMVILPDGRPFVLGGTIQYDPFYGQLRTSAYDPATGQFVDMQQMAHGRWYPTGTVLSDGSVMVFSGLNETGATNPAVEIYKVGAGWSQQYIAPFTPPLYPRLHLLPNGTVFNSAPSPVSNIFDPSTKTWQTNVATTVFGGDRTYGSSVLLPLTPANNYKPRIFILGGGNPGTRSTEMIDLSATSPHWVAEPAMSQPRIEMNATMMPNGTVLAMGGSMNDEDATTASLNADLYNVSGSTITMSSAGANAYPRLYHSVSLLLPDATVLLAGGNPTRGVFEPHIEIYTPPYLYNSNGTLATRPTISSVTPGVIGWGGTFQVSSPDAANISSVVLMRAGAVTHAFNMEQRMVGLNYTVNGNTLTVTAPPNGNIAPPGYYMLFLLNSVGVPSVAGWVQISSAPTDIPPTGSITSPASDVTIVAGQLVNFAGTGTDPDGTVTGYSWVFPGGTPATSSSADPGGVTFSTPGTYVVSLTVTDNNGLTDPSPETRTIHVESGFSLSAQPSSQTTAPGGQTSFTVSVVASNTFTGVVTFGVSGLPSGVTPTFNPTTVTGSGSTTLTLASNSAAPSGTYALTITGTSGTLTQTTNATLVIGPATTTATPTILPASGTYTSATVSISDATSGAKIYYTTDGSTPIPGSGTTAPYTAPFPIVSSLTVNAMATSSGLSNSAEATAQYSIVPFPSILVHAAATTAYSDVLGQSWSADTGFTGGSAASTTSAIKNTPDQALYQSERFGTFSYNFTVPNGNYNVLLKFAEIYWTAAGQRMFNVTINGNQVLTNFDIIAATGAPLTAIDKVFPVTVTNGAITIQFTPGAADQPKVNAIQINQSTGVGVQINPPSANLTASQTQQFTATVSGTTNKNVYWWMGSAAGTLSKAGLYTAPAIITAPQTVNIYATSLADTTQTSVATAGLTLNGAFIPILVRAGGPAYTDTQGELWSADYSFTGGAEGSTTRAIANTTDPALYQDERYGVFSYNFPVPNGNYNVVLKFAEIYWSQVGQRMFNVAINGTQVLTNFDIVAAAGGSSSAIDKTFPVTVTNGAVNIQFSTGAADLPKISSIEITQAGVAVQVSPSSTNLGPSQTQQLTATVSGSTNTAVTWTMNPQVGTLSSGGLYTAPASVTSAQTITITATSQADTTKSGQATINLTPQTVSIQVSPPSTTLTASQTQQMTATVTGTTNTAVTWTMNPQVGMLSSGGLYTAPFPITSAQTITITATSQADTTKSAQGSISLTPVGVQVNPPSANLVASQTQQMTATVTGTTNTAVTWTMSPQVGTLSSSGLYTAPSTITTAQTITITATSQADTSKSAQASIHLQIAGAFTPILIRAGGPAYTDTLGQLWSADTDFTGGSEGQTTRSISNTSDPALYQDERYGVFAYNFTVPNGNYNVVLKFAEVYWSKVGQRMFNVAINGTQVLTNFDIIAAAGAASTAVDKTFPVTVTNGAINIQFTTGAADLPKVSAIEISQTGVVVGVSVQVSPPSTSLSASQTQQMTASVTGTTNTAVTWTMNPQVGTLSTSGLYTAPASIAAAQAVTITATSQADTAKSGQATINLQPATSFAPILVHAGGTAYTDTQGQVWSADNSFTGGATSSTSHSISNTSDPALYQTERYGSFSYNFSVPNGNYNVLLKFAEIYWSQAGQRKFNVIINGDQILTNFDIIATAGAPFTALDETFPVSVTNGAINIQFTTGAADLPKVSALEIMPGGVSVQVNPHSTNLNASQNQQMTAVVTGTTNTAVTWSMNPQVGTLSSSGLYTAPSTITTAQTITITATSQADSTKSGQATINLLVPGSFSPILVHVAGGAYTDSLGQVWSADKGFTGGSLGNTTQSISNTPDPVLYQSERYGVFSYNFTVPNGNYNVLLKFAEIYWSQVGQRMFNVSINGTQVLTNFDIVAAAGGSLKAIDKTFPVTVTNGTINIQFTSGAADLPKVSSIEIH